MHGKDGGDGLVWMVVAAALEALEAAVMVVPVKLLIVGQQATPLYLRSTMGYLSSLIFWWCARQINSSFCSTVTNLFCIHVGDICSSACLLLNCRCSYWSVLLYMCVMNCQQRISFVVSFHVGKRLLFLLLCMMVAKPICKSRINLALML